jgi:hypothetical protein
MGDLGPGRDYRMSTHGAGSPLGGWPRTDRPDRDQISCLGFGFGDRTDRLTCRNATLRDGQRGALQCFSSRFVLEFGKPGCGTTQPTWFASHGLDTGLPPPRRQRFTAEPSTPRADTARSIHRAVFLRIFPPVPNFYVRNCFPGASHCPSARRAVQPMHHRPAPSQCRRWLETSAMRLPQPARENGHCAPCPG